MTIFLNFIKLTLSFSSTVTMLSYSSIYRVKLKIYAIVNDQVSTSCNQSNLKQTTAIFSHGYCQLQKNHSHIISTSTPDRATRLPGQQAQCNAHEYFIDTSYLTIFRCFDAYHSSSRSSLVGYVIVHDNNLILQQYFSFYHLCFMCAYVEI